MAYAEVMKQQSRRTFLQVASLGATASLLTVTRWSPVAEAAAAGSTEALLLSCMDYRLVDDIEKYMSGRGLRDKYDHIVLAGASLGAVTDKFPAWNETFWEHLDVAIKLHAIHKVIVMDHLDCGAYKEIFGAAKVADPKAEHAAHVTQLKLLKSQINKKHPKLEVEMLIMSLDGKVEVIAA